MIILILTFLLTGTFAVKPGKNGDDWDLLKLTQTWPPAACIFIENEGLKCSIPSGVTGWMIHGLWPTKSGTQGPNFCNDSWVFNPSQVEVLRPALDNNWPSITLNETPETTWKHEWEKHGTCGTVLPALKDEIHYFNFTLNLHYFFDLYRILSDRGVEPVKDQKFQPNDLLEIMRGTIGAYPTITCVKEKSTENFFMEQVEICVNKSFQPVDCDAKPLLNKKIRAENSKSLIFYPESNVKNRIIDCPASDGVYYLPFQ